MIGLNYLGKLGQLGNQMFQYAALMGIADRLETTYTIPHHDEVVEDGLGNKLRIELFDAFRLNPKNLGMLNSDKVYQEKTFEFDPKVFDIKEKNFILYGFFQSEKYFYHVKNKVKNQFAFHPYIKGQCMEMVEQMDNPIALHIRRGDYLINSANHHNLSMEYYENALKEFDDDRQVIIFSDDPDWCHTQDLFQGERFLIAENNGPYHDLYLMTQCKDFIIANSTFSWWGAWLADTGDVIAPNKWFGPNNADKSTKDLYPESWKVIPYS